MFRWLFVDDNDDNGDELQVHNKVVLPGCDESALKIYTHIQELHTPTGSPFASHTPQKVQYIAVYI